MFLYTENLRDFTKKLLETNRYNEVIGYKINVQKSTGFLHNKNETSEKEMIKIILQLQKNIPRKIPRNKGCEGPMY